LATDGAVVFQGDVAERDVGPRADEDARPGSETAAPGAATVAPIATLGPSVLDGQVADRHRPTLDEEDPMGTAAIDGQAAGTGTVDADVGID